MNGQDPLNFTNGEMKDDALETSETMPLISIPSKGLSIEREIEQVEKNIELFNRIKTVSLKLTKPSDWIDQGGSPYLMDRGAENIAIAWGVDISDVRLTQEWAEDEKGRYYTYVVSGKAYSKKLGRYVEDIGVCSQRDRFFGMVKGGLKPIEEVDMANIRRKAVTNLYTRLIKRVIGLMNVTFDDLTAAGMNVASIQKIEYKNGQAKVDATLSKTDLDMRGKIWDICLQMTGGSEEDAKEKLGDLTEFKGRDGNQVRITDIGKITKPAWIKSIHTKAQKMLAEADQGV